MYRLCLWDYINKKWVNININNEMEYLISFGNYNFVESTRLIIHDNETGEVYKEWLVPGKDN